MNNVLVDCTDNVTECACAAMATTRRTYTTFHRGLTCANNQCPTCLQTHTCQNNRILNIAVATNTYTFSNNYICYCDQGQAVPYNTRTGSYETPYQTIFSACQQLQSTAAGFLIWYDDQNIDPSCFSIASDNTETIVGNCDEGGLTGSVTRRSEIKFVMLAQITVPPCGTWLKAGAFKKEMISMESGCECLPGQTPNDFVAVTTYCFPTADTPLFGCNYNGINFDIPNPYNTTTSTCMAGTVGTSTPNGCP